MHRALSLTNRKVNIMGKALKMARQKFDKLNSLNADIDEGGMPAFSARKEKGRMQDTWRNRFDKRAGSLWNKRNAKPGVVMSGMLA